MNMNISISGKKEEEEGVGEGGTQRDPCFVSEQSASEAPKKSHKEGSKSQPHRLTHTVKLCWVIK